jgi:hypothetical protein
MTPARLAMIAMLGAGIALGWASAALAQPPRPKIPNIEQRSGLLTRFISIDPHLPPDPRRDQWYDTRWGDPPNLRKHPNTVPNGGLYGLRWRAKDTLSIPPYFLGSSGQNTITPHSAPPHWAFRNISAWVHPFKPVGMYYEQGSYVPVYDLDPVVPGSGSWPWPFFMSPTHGGG